MEIERNGDQVVAGCDCSPGNLGPRSNEVFKGRGPACCHGEIKIGGDGWEEKAIDHVESTHKYFWTNEKVTLTMCQSFGASGGEHM